MRYSLFVSTRKEIELEIWGDAPIVYSSLKTFGGDSYRASCILDNGSRRVAEFPVDGLEARKLADEVIALAEVSNEEQDFILDCVLDMLRRKIREGGEADA